LAIIALTINITIENNIAATNVVRISVSIRSGDG
jgi:hypothetical protein